MQHKQVQAGLIDATAARGCLSFVRGSLFLSALVISPSRREEGCKVSVTHVTGTRERYIPDKSYWLVSSFNGNVVPLNGVRAEVKKEGKNKGMKYKPGGGKETAIDR